MNDADEEGRQWMEAIRRQHRAQSDFMPRARPRRKNDWGFLIVVTLLLTAIYFLGLSFLAGTP